MFTGIIQDQGQITELIDTNGGRQITVNAENGFFDSSKIGDSVAHDGVCLTVVKNHGDKIEVFAMIETLIKTTIGSWKKGDNVNLELPLKMGDPLGGHIVQGHVDTTTRVLDIENRQDGSRYVVFELPQDIDRFVVDRGSICIQGVSLTVASKEQGSFSVALIPETLSKTTLGELKVDDQVNIEIDNIARYVEQMISARGL